MSARASIQFSPRQKGQSFNQRPEEVTHQIYVHRDGMPSFLGAAIGDMLLASPGDNGTGCLAAQAVVYFKLNMQYNKIDTSIGNVYLEQPNAIHSSIDYRYIIWTGIDKETMISIFNYLDECIFVGSPTDLTKLTN